MQFIYFKYKSFDVSSIFYNEDYDALKFTRYTQKIFFPQYNFLRAVQKLSRKSDIFNEYPIKKGLMLLNDQKQGVML